MTIESLPDLFRRLWACGLTTTAACGDDTRNITGRPLAGVAADEICAASPLVIEAQTDMGGEGGILQLTAEVQDLYYGLPCLAAFDSGLG